QATQLPQSGLVQCFLTLASTMAHSPACVARQQKQVLPHRPLPLDWGQRTRLNAAERRLEPARRFAGAKGCSQQLSVNAGRPRGRNFIQAALASLSIDYTAMRIAAYWR